MDVKFLLTGAGGFIGQYLCREILSRGWQVRAAVRSPCQLPMGVEMVVAGAIDADTNWDDALHGIDVVIHLAARVHIMHDTAADPLAEFLKVNTHGAVNLARQAAAAGVKRLVYLSSIKVNGECTASSQVVGGQDAFSDADPSNPQGAYAISKWQAEQALHHIAEDTGLEVVIIRSPLVYGPGVKGNFISLLAVVYKGFPLPLAGAANVRSLVYVGNLVDALIACATHPAAASKTYLVSDGEPVSTRELVDKIAQSLGCSSRMFYFPPFLLRFFAAMLGRSAQIDRLFNSLRINDNKIRRELGWKPPYRLEQGLRITADWYRTQHPR